MGENVFCFKSVIIMHLTFAGLLLHLQENQKIQVFSKLKYTTTSYMQLASRAFSDICFKFRDLFLDTKP